MVFLPPPSLSAKPSIGKGMFSVVSITQASGVPTMVGVEESFEAASVLCSFPLSCLHIEQVAKPQKSEVKRK